MVKKVDAGSINFSKSKQVLLSIILLIVLILPGSIVQAQAQYTYPDNVTCNPVLSWCDSYPSNLFAVDDFFYSCVQYVGGIGWCEVEGTIPGFMGGELQYRIKNVYPSLTEIDFQNSDGTWQNFFDIPKTNGEHSFILNGNFNGHWKIQFASLDANSGFDYIRVYGGTFSTPSSNNIFAYLLAGIVWLIQHLLLPLFGDTSSQTAAMNLAGYIGQGGYVVFELVYDTLGSVVNLSLFALFMSALIFFFFVRLIIAIYKFILGLLPVIGH